MRINRVYTKSGDEGETGLVGGQRLPKNHARFEAYGSIDELSAALGWARQELQAEAGAFAEPRDSTTADRFLEFLGNKLFTLGGDLATRLDDRHPQMPVIIAEDIDYLEHACDAFNNELPPLQDFILPGGCRTSAALHTARTVARRAEREVVALSRAEPTGGLPEKYLNRLSDLLFVLARWVNRRQGFNETIWRRDLPEPPLPIQETQEPDDR